MRRRAVLQGSLALLAGGLAGCIANSGGNQPDDTTAGTSAQTTAGSTTTAGTTTADGSTTDESSPESTAATTADPGDETTADLTEETTTEPTDSQPGADSGDGTTTEQSTTVGVAGGPTLVEQSFRIAAAECGTGADAAEASAEGDAVSVAGTIPGRDACQRARVAGLDYDAADDAFSVLVETYAEGEMCSQCLFDVEYEASFRFEGGLPERVVVRHRSRGETRTASETTL